MANEQMEFPGTWEEYEKDYGFNDSKEVYTNISRLIPSFRVKQWLDHLPSVQPTDKENLVVEDCISRAELLKAVDTWDKFGCDADSKLVPYKDCYVPYIHYDDVVKAIKGMPSIQPKQNEWIPVSERLPEDFQRVLVTIVNYKGDKVVRVAEYYNRKGVFQIKENHEQWEVGEKGLLAWMPLPEPYTAESEG